MRVEPLQEQWNQTKGVKAVFEGIIQIWKQPDAPSNEQEFEEFFSKYYRFVRHEEKAVEDLTEAIHKECCKRGLAKRTPAGMDDRVTALTLGLDQAYQGKFDLEQFNERVYETFKWFGESHDKYLSPVQWNGQNKTGEAIQNSCRREERL